MTGAWTRLRMVYSALKTAIGMTISDTNALGCEWKLLAKDGIYVADAPR